ncbi:MAG: DUF1284 domain-containing protein [Methanobacteriaceae archaeon]|nr:DUF1284 domain-containing protein [Methanobacteriaceae archaeon]
MLKKTGTGDFSNPIKIRAHHLLCIQGFQGYGYSREFEENMWQIIDNLNATDLSYVKITSECDDICYKCPHNQDNTCNESSLSKSHVVDMDRIVLEKIRVDEGFIGKSSVIFEKVNSIFNNIKNLQEVCSKCFWHSKCIYYQKIMNLTSPPYQINYK